MSDPTLSVCMINFNHAHYLERSLEGIVTQSRPPDEFVILDDASTDESVEVIQRYADEYAFIRFLQNEKNCGAVSAGNQVFALANGDWYYGVGADDCVLPGALEAVMDMAGKHPDVGIIFGPMLMVDGEGNQLGVIESSRWKESLHASPEQFLREYLDVELPGHSQGASTIYRREALVEIGGYRNELGHWTDSFAARVLGLRHGVGHVREPIAAWTKLRGSLSGASQQDPHLMLDIIARAVWLMRSDEFSEWTPRDYVERWEKGARETVIEQERRAIRDAMRSRVERVGGGRASLPLRWLTDQAYKLLAAVACSGLRRYEGDTSCYDTDS